MSLQGQVLDYLESAWRIIVPTMPAAAEGAERGWRPANELQPGQTPHLFLFDLAERTERLIFQQRRISIQGRGQLVRIGDDYPTALADWEGFRVGIIGDPTLANLVEWSTVELEDVEDAQASQSRVVTWSWSAVAVI